MGTETKGQHTPGPLTARHSELMRGVVQVFDSGGFPIANFARAGKSGENLANAILFSAAPKLLAAAKAVVRRLDNGDSIEPGWYEAERLRAAIARAKGGALGTRTPQTEGG